VPPWRALARLSGCPYSPSSASEAAFREASVFGARYPGQDHLTVCFFQGGVLERVALLVEQIKPAYHGDRGRAPLGHLDDQGRRELPPHAGGDYPGVSGETCRDDVCVQRQQSVSQLDG
jgi:hypothetical protein